MYDVQISSKINVYSTTYRRRFTFHTGMKIRSSLLLSLLFRIFYLCSWNSYHLCILWPEQKVHTLTREKNVQCVCASPYRIQTLNSHSVSHVQRCTFPWIYETVFFSENATTRWLNLALVCFWPFCILPLMKDNRKSLCTFSFLHIGNELSTPVLSWCYSSSKLRNVHIA